MEDTLRESVRGWSVKKGGGGGGIVRTRSENDSLPALTVETRGYHGGYSERKC